MKRLFFSLCLLLAIATPSFAQMVNQSGFYGDIDVNQVFDMKFSTQNTSTWAPATLAGSPVITVYKNNSTTPEATHPTLSVDFNSVTGFHNVRIDTSVDGTFYAAGSYFTVIISTGTVNSVSVVGQIVGSFSMGRSVVLTSNASSNIGTFFDNGTAATTAVVGNLTQLQTVQRGVAFNNFPVWMLNATGGAVTGQTVTCNISKDGGSYAASTNPVSEVANGQYKFNMTATEDTATVMAMVCTGTGGSNGPSIPYRTNVTPLH